MNDYSNREELIAALTQDLTPVKRMKPRDGALLIALATLAAGVASVAIFKWWSGLLTGEASGYFIITYGLLLVLGIASTAALVSGALPRVGMRGNGPFWGAAMLAILPIGAVFGLLFGHEANAHSGLNDPAALHCVLASLAAALLVAGAAVVWLRRGAPVSLERSGWLTGLAAGSLGSLAYGITCPVDSLSHVGLWHVAPVAITAVIGRFAVPPLIRW